MSISSFLKIKKLIGLLLLGVIISIGFVSNSKVEAQSYMSDLCVVPTNPGVGETITFSVNPQYTQQRQGYSGPMITWKVNGTPVAYGQTYSKLYTTTGVKNDVIVEVYFSANLPYGTYPGGINQPSSGGVSGICSVNVVTKLNPRAENLACDAQGGRIKVNWSPIYNAVGYKIYRGAPGTYVTTTTNLLYEGSGWGSGIFTVSALYADGTESQRESISITPSGRCVCIASSHQNWNESLQNLTVNVGDNVTYRVYVSGTMTPLDNNYHPGSISWLKNGSYVSVPYPASSYSQQYLEPGVYQTQATGFNVNYVNSSSSCPIVTVVPLGKPIPTKNDLTCDATGGKISFSWPAVEGVNQYRVFPDYAQGGYVTTSSTTFIQTGLVPGRQYSFEVASYNNGALSEKSSITVTANTVCPVPPEAPIITVETLSCNVQDATAKTWFTWTGSSGVTYEVYRADTLNGNYQLINPPDAPINNQYDYTDRIGLTAGNTYHYKVRAIRDGLQVDSLSKSAIAVIPKMLCPDVTVNLTANPTTIQSGSNTTLSWTTTNAESCRMSTNTNNTQWSGTVITPLSGGSKTITGLTQNTTFTLNCIGVNGSNASASASVTVTIPAPTVQEWSLSCAELDATTARARITWTAVGGVAGYKIYRSTSQNGTYTQIGSQPINVVTYIDEDSTLSAGTTYYYKVRSYTASGIESVFSNDISVVAHSKSTRNDCAPPPAPQPVAAILACDTTGGTVKFTWPAIAGATGYNIYDYTGTKKLVDATTSLSYTATGFAPRNSLKYYVSTLNANGESIKTPITLDTNDICAPVLATNVLACSPTGGQVFIRWYPAYRPTDAIYYGALQYRVYDYTGNTPLETVTGGVYNDSSRYEFRYSGTGFSPSTDLGFYVASYNWQTGYESVKVPITARSNDICPLPNVPTITDGGLSCNSLDTVAKTKITWAAVTGASGYYVYRFDESSATYKQIGTLTGVNSTTYTDRTSGIHTVTSGTTYTYMVRAYNTYGSSLDSNSLPIKAQRPADLCEIQPPVLTAQPRACMASDIVGNQPVWKTRITWTAVSGATGYRVYRSTSQNGTYTQIAPPVPVNGIDYTDVSGNLSPGITYYYKVRAYNNAGVESPDSNIAETTTPIVCQPAITLNSQCIENSGNSGVLVSWNNNVGSPTGYKVYKERVGYPGYLLLTQVNGGNITSYMDGDVLGGQGYNYKVRAINGSEESIDSYDRYIQAQAPVLLGCTAPNVTVNLTANPTTIQLGSSTKLSWTTTNATSCTMSASPTNVQWSGTNISPLVGGSSTIASLTQNTTFMLNCTGANGSTASSSVTVTVQALPPEPPVVTPVSLACDATGGKIQFTWSAVPGVIGYHIYDYEGQPLVSTTTALTYTASGFTPGSSIGYYVSAVNAYEESTKVYVTVTANEPCPPSAPHITLGDIACSEGDTMAKTRFTWSVVDGADGYSVYRKLATDTQFSEINNLSGSLLASITEGNRVDYTDVSGNLAAGRVYEYKVRAYSFMNGSDPNAWGFCSNEYEMCNFSGIRQIRYGKNGVYTEPRTFTDGVSCNNDVFGDPLYGTVKECLYLNARYSEYSESIEIVAQTPDSVCTPNPSEEALCTGSVPSGFASCGNNNPSSDTNWTAINSQFNCPVNSQDASACTYGCPIGSTYNPQTGVCASENITCEFDGDIYGSGDTVRVYQSSLVPANGQCQAGTITCTATGWTGDTSYTATSCRVSPNIQPF